MRATDDRSSFGRWMIKRTQRSSNPKHKSARRRQRCRTLMPHNLRVASCFRPWRCLVTSISTAIAEKSMSVCWWLCRRVRRCGISIRRLASSSLSGCRREIEPKAGRGQAATCPRMCCRDNNTGTEYKWLSQWTQCTLQLNMREYMPVSVRLRSDRARRISRAR